MSPDGAGCANPCVRTGVRVLFHFVLYVCSQVVTLEEKHIFFVKNKIFLKIMLPVVVS